MRPIRPGLPSLLLALAATAASANVAPVVNVTSPVTFTLTQGSFSTQVQAVERAQSAASFYNYFSASSHTGFEAPFESKIFLYRDTTTGLLSLFITHNIDRDSSGIATGNGSVRLDLDGVPPGTFVAQSDDPFQGFRAELDLTIEPEGFWDYVDNTDGGVLDGLPTDQPWCLSIEPLLFDNVTSWVYHYASGAPIPLTLTETVTICFQPATDLDVLDVDEGNDASLSGSFDDPDAFDVHAAAWDYGDGSAGPATYAPGAGFTHHDCDPVFHAYGDDGSYSAVLSVDDGAGGTGQDDITVRVRNVTPTLLLGTSYVTGVGIGLNVPAQGTDPGSDDLSFTWDFGDGSPTVTNDHYNDGAAPDPSSSPAGTFPFAATDTVHHAWCEPGTYLLSVQLADDDGASTTRTATVSVLAFPTGSECNGAPACSAGPDALAACGDLQAQGSGVDPDGDPLSYSWTSSCPGTTFSPGPDVAAPLVTLPASCDVTCVLSLTVTDPSGLSCTDDATFRIHDDVPPSVTAGSVGACYPSAAAAEAAAVAATSASDACSGPVSFSASSSGTCAASVVVTATDACGNFASVTYATRVDGAPPAFSGVPGDATVACDAVPPPATPAAVDACDPAPAVGFSEARVDGACADRYVLTRTWTATDSCGNVGTASQVLTVRDDVAPSFAGVPASATVACNAVPSPATPTASDACDPAPSVTFAESRANGPCLDTYVLTRTWTATDRCGNSSTATQTLTVQDTVAPALSGVPASATVACNAVPSPATPTASDACDPAPSVTFAESRVDGSCAGNYVLTRTWTATDRCGNATSQSQVLRVEDREGPIVTESLAPVACLWPPNHRMATFGPSSFSPDVRDACSEPVTWRFTGCASDQPENGIGDGNTEPDCVIAADGLSFAVRAERQGPEPAGRRYVVQIVATDACGNASAPATIGTILVPHDQSPHADCIATTGKR